MCERQEPTATGEHRLPGAGEAEGNWLLLRVSAMTEAWAVSRSFVNEYFLSPLGGQHYSSTDDRALNRQNPLVSKSYVNTLNLQRTREGATWCKERESSVGETGELRGRREAHPDKVLYRQTIKEARSLLYGHLQRSWSRSISRRFERLWGGQIE